MRSNTLAAAAALALLCAAPASAQSAGLLAGANKGEIPQITLSAGMPIAEGPITLSSGTYYELEIVGDGSAEMTLMAPEFFRAIWIDEIVINDLEVRPLGLDSVEFDDEGEMEIGFVAIKPGVYEMYVPGGGETQRVTITIQ